MTRRSSFAGIMMGVLAALALAAPSAGRAAVNTGLLESNEAISVGRPAPRFTGKDLAGADVSLSAFLGRPVLIDFGSIFCGSCQEALADFKRLEDEYRGTDLAIIFITDGMAPVEAHRNYFRQLGATYTVIRDKEYAIFEKYGVKIIPFQVLIDRRGVVRKINVGFDPDLEKRFDLKRMVGSRKAGEAP